MLRPFRLAIIALLIGMSSSRIYAAQENAPVTAAPEVFAPGVISGPANDGAPTFTPDGKTLYFGRSGASWGFIVESHFIDGKWSEPRIAPFSGLWPDSQPALSPDGSRLVFQSTRPPSPPADGEKPAAGFHTSALWQVTRTAAGWSEPVRLPDTVNITTNIWRPTIAADGTLYFMTRAAADKTWRLYQSRNVNGVYEKAEPLSFSSGATTDVDPEVAPDQSFLIFSSAGRAAPDDAKEHLYIAFRDGSAWSDITPLRYAGDYAKNPSDDGEARLSRDGRTLYFTSSRTVPIHANRTREEAAEDFKRITSWDNSNNNVWSISLAPWLDARPRAPRNN